MPQDSHSNLSERQVTSLEVSYMFETNWLSETARR